MGWYECIDLCGNVLCIVGYCEYWCVVFVEVGLYVWNVWGVMWM